MMLFSSLGYTQVVDTATWTTQDIEKNFKTKYFCNKNLSKEDCDKNFRNMKEYGIDVNSLGNQDIKDIQLDKISYTTTNSFPATGETTSHVSGLVMLPDTNHPKGVVLYYHPTVFDNAGVPSNLDKKMKLAYISIQFMLLYMLLMDILLLLLIILVKEMTIKTTTLMFYTQNRLLIQQLIY